MPVEIEPKVFNVTWHCPIAVELTKIDPNLKHTLFAHRHKCQTLCRLEHPNWMMRNTMILRDTAMPPTMRQWSPIYMTERGPSWQSTALCLQPISVIFIPRLPLNYRVLPFFLRLALLPLQPSTKGLHGGDSDILICSPWLSVCIDSLGHSNRDSCCACANQLFHVGKFYDEFAGTERGTKGPNIRHRTCAAKYLVGRQTTWHPTKPGLCEGTHVGPAEGETMICTWCLVRIGMLKHFLETCQKPSQNNLWKQIWDQFLTFPPQKLGCASAPWIWAHVDSGSDMYKGENPRESSRGNKPCQFTPAPTFFLWNFQATFSQIISYKRCQAQTWTVKTVFGNLGQRKEIVAQLWKHKFSVETFRINEPCPDAWELFAKPIMLCRRFLLT